jgi:hypothetical protein
MNGWLDAIWEPGRGSEWGLHFSYSGVEGLLAVGIVCVVSVLCMVLWLLATQTCLRSRSERGA